MKKIKLNNLATRKMNSKEMRDIKGLGVPGNCCCACAYRDRGGSSVIDNHTANLERGLFSDDCPEEIKDILRKL